MMFSVDLTRFELDEMAQRVAERQIEIAQCPANVTIEDRCMVRVLASAKVAGVWKEKRPALLKRPHQ
jgi:hypothetical protein